jgi:hypothetical protein
MIDVDRALAEHTAVEVPRRLDAAVEAMIRVAVLCGQRRGPWPRLRLPLVAAAVLVLGTLAATLVRPLLLPATGVATTEPTSALARVLDPTGGDEAAPLLSRSWADVRTLYLAGS